MDIAFTRIDISQWRFVRTEQAGQGENDWYHRPGTPPGPRGEWLFKPVKFHGRNERQGGDWSEKAASELAKVLGVPAAEVELAARGQEEGCISRQVRDESWELVMGKIWMHYSQDIDYWSENANKPIRRGKASQGYTLQNIKRSLEGVGPPPGYPELESMSAWDVFSGYLLLDAIIANQDRHEENWAVLRSAFGPEQARLAPTFDQEGGLGYQLTDQRRQEHLDGRRLPVSEWAARGKAARFWQPTGAGQLSLVDAFGWAITRVSASVADFWLDKVEQLTPGRVGSVFERLTVMSEAQTRFASALVQANVERIQREHRRPAG